MGRPSRDGTLWSLSRAMYLEAPRLKAIWTDSGSKEPERPEATTGIWWRPRISRTLSRTSWPPFNGAFLESEVAELAGNVTHRELLDQAAEACRAGIPRVHLLDGKMRGVLVEELFSEEGVGTMVHTDSYREIRPLKEEDIPELLSMIARSVVDSKLVNRNYEDIAARMDSYYVLTLDDSIVGCVAVYPYPEHHSAELGCLYIKHRHEGRGYGRALCEFAKRKAEEMGMEFIFALSQSAVHYFRDRMHYAEFSRDSLPPERLRTLELSGRKSGVFGLRLK